jgi:hypothetical protein
VRCCFLLALCPRVSRCICRKSVLPDRWIGHCIASSLSLGFHDCLLVAPMPAAADHDALNHMTTSLRCFQFAYPAL